jgi:hypothetical protein
MPASNKDKKKAAHHYWRVIVTYSDNETSGNRVFKDRTKAMGGTAKEVRLREESRARTVGSGTIRRTPSFETLRCQLAGGRGCW